MAGFKISQNLFNLATGSIRNTSAKINMLNFELQTIDEISGNVIGGSITIDANADIRRTCSISIAVTNSSFDVQPGGRVWLDKYFQVFTGIKNYRDDTIEWVNRGIYIVDSPHWEFDSNTNTLTLEGLDLMAKMTGVRNGYLEGIPTIIPQGSSIRDSMIKVLTQLGGFNKYLIEDNPQKVPYDIRVEQGGTVYDILKQLRDITPNYEIFFDVDGVFIYRKIPSGENEPVLIDDTTWNNLVIKESIDTDFSSVKNVVEVWGKSHNSQHFGGTAEAFNGTYSILIDDVTAYETNLLYSFIAPTIMNNPQLKINSLAAVPIVDSKGNPAVIPKASTYYVVQYQANNTFLFLGYQQAYAIAEDTNPQSPFYVNSTVGKIRIVLYGGEYDNIYSNELAQERADYELYLRTRMNDSISLQCVPIPYIDVNIVVSYSQRTSSSSQLYIIKHITENIDISGTQEISMIRYYPLYPTTLL